MLFFQEYWTVVFEKLRLLLEVMGWPEINRTLNHFLTPLVHGYCGQLTVGYYERTIYLPLLRVVHDSFPKWSADIPQDVAMVTTPHTPHPPPESVCERPLRVASSWPNGRPNRISWRQGRDTPIRIPIPFIQGIPWKESKPNRAIKTTRRKNRDLKEDFFLGQQKIGTSWDLEWPTCVRSMKF